MQDFKQKVCQYLTYVSKELLRLLRSRAKMEAGRPVLSR